MRSWGVELAHHSFVLRLIKSVAIQGAANTTVCLKNMEPGVVISWPENGASTVLELDEAAALIACGTTHSFVATVKGNLLAWGDNRHR